MLIDGFAERFLECFEKSPSVDFPIDLTSLYALHTDPQEEFWQRIHFAQLAFALPSTRHGYLTDGLGASQGPNPGRCRCPVAGHPQSCDRLLWKGSCFNKTCVCVRPVVAGPPGKSS